MKVLMIANSFGVNLQTYASMIAKSNGYDLDLYVLFIGGCTLEQHSNNIKNDAKLYELYHNGSSTKQIVSIKEALYLKSWDYVSLQQGSHASGYIDKYHPYFEEVYDYVKSIYPNVKMIFHQTWAYSPINTYKYIDTPNYAPFFNFKNYDEMKSGIDSCLNEILKVRHIDLVINSGDMVSLAIENNLDPYDIYGFHMNSIGCYLIGLNMVRILFKSTLKEIYVPCDIDKNICIKLFNLINKNNYRD